MMALPRQKLEYFPIEKAVPGMPLAEQIMISERGVVKLLLPVGHLLSEGDLTRLDRLRIDYVCVSTPDTRSDEEIKKQRAQALLQTRKIFESADLSQPHIMALFKRMLVYRSEHL